MKIGEFARLSGVSVRALRHYDEIGLLRPERTDPVSGYRQYCADQLRTLQWLLALRGVGFGLEQSQALISGGADLHAALLTQRRELQQNIRTQAERLARLDAWVQNLGEPMTQHDVQIQSLPALRMASLRDAALVKRMPEGGQDMTAMWKVLWTAFPDSKREPGTSLIWHDSGDTEYPEPELLHPLSASDEAPAPFTRKDLPEVARAAVLTYQGHYADQGMTDAFAAIHRFGENPVHPAREAVRQVFNGAANQEGSVLRIELQLPLT